ncbi:hypothetical protein ACU6T4_10945 [Avibacterium paragallinarum]|uniref:hypothetical protein n=1 Tax=Avibacterium paragallinarum TaxID=728 RepID=UPI00021AD39C|nr:hypothetical protein [Avibacterium paragallinarum]AZI13642.1 hypothetical protein EIA51_02685 [Avibacterium paragallinarum]QIR12044.1 hypothetical protein HBL79_07250 [Avibacterium paragallinarum]QJE09136.1 hypothetical protein HHJ62_01790 [Avibacterium paragallinarum]QJE11332.1 hypothetical protein HHJ61_01790 [Avibacterium paragallinarum]QJE13530.1 hypothetical protein HHJ60_01800 [Avibacterium paragallinarum]
MTNFTKADLLDELITIEFLFHQAKEALSKEDLNIAFNAIKEIRSAKYSNVALNAYSNQQILKEMMKIIEQGIKTSTPAEKENEGGDYVH